MKERLHVPRAAIEAELADYQRQHTEAQQQLTMWQQKMLLADGAAQACKALLEKKETLDENAPAGDSTQRGSLGAGGGGLSAALADGANGGGSG